MADLQKHTLAQHPKLIFMGTPDFAVPSLNALLNRGYDIRAVITQPDRPKGRGKKIAASSVKQLAVEKGIDLFQPARISDDHFLNLIRNKEPDLIIVVAFGRMLGRAFLAIPEWGTINIHASLLPLYRGPAPIQRAIINDDKKTGLTIMHMDEGLDTGPIMSQEDVPILKYETAGQLHDKLARISGDLIISFLDKMSKTTISERPQDHSMATYAEKIERGIACIDWYQPADRISALIRALDPRPGAYTLLHGKEVKLFSPRIIDEKRSDVVPGKVVYSKDVLRIETCEGVIEIREMQYPGRKRLPASDFLRGVPLAKGTELGK